MTTYFLRRTLLIIPTFLGITVLVFCITRFVPGGPVERMIAEMRAQKSLSGGSTNRSDAALSEDQINQLKEYYGFDKPILVSYSEWLWKILRFDLGESTRYGEPVWQTIKERLPISIFFGVTTLLISYLICIPLGIFKALRHGSSLDSFSSIVVFTGYAVPAYVVGLVLLLLFASHWEFFPLGGFSSDDFDDLSLFGKIGDVLYHAALPLTAYIVGDFAVKTFLMKNSLMDHLAADYVRTACAKGRSFYSAVYRHALQNSLIPLATSFGSSITVILSGSFLIEQIFNIDGFGLLGYESVVERDYPVVMGILVISSLLQLVGNILSDICIALVDPRVKF